MAETTAAWTLHPDRMLPAEPTERAIARRLYSHVRGPADHLPHGHVPPEWIAQDLPFHDPTSLLPAPTTTSAGCCTPTA
ncbi:MAG: hypothetical protein IPM08_13660, partial [Actinomycetales bacterium]|nr:hypothetical protein [Actinomycetales bacterium]